MHFSPKRCSPILQSFTVVLQ